MSTPTRSATTAKSLSRPALDPLKVEPRTGTIYPARYAPVTRGRAKRSLGAALGLTRFGVNLTELAPGASSSLRHFHSREDEFVWIVEGEAILVTDEGRQTLAAGACAGFPAGGRDGHQLINESTSRVLYLEVGTRDPEDEVGYSDVDLRCAPGRYATPSFTKRDGSPLDDDG